MLTTVHRMARPATLKTITACTGYTATAKRVGATPKKMEICSAASDATRQGTRAE